ncbi:hypothetical protein [Segnochrobactrum spirostomi]|uniref:hypothetical protein n=1 Tax=Segnochrobactrum spirostomi TaxID=2608987 RepID=UPI001AD844CA|nr:hypothetical protein [Segnochrobactrum spirostomi]
MKSVAPGSGGGGGEGLAVDVGDERLLQPVAAQGIAAEPARAQPGEECAVPGAK